MPWSASFHVYNLIFRLFYIAEFRRITRTARSILGWQSRKQLRTAAKVPAPEVELSDCFCGHCSAISIERFRRKVSFSGIAGVSEWMTRRPTTTVHHSELIGILCRVARGIPQLWILHNQSFYIFNVRSYIQKPKTINAIKMKQILFNLFLSLSLTLFY